MNPIPFFVVRNVRHGRMPMCLRPVRQSGAYETMRREQSRECQKRLRAKRQKAKRLVRFTKAVAKLVNNGQLFINYEREEQKVRQIPKHIRKTKIHRSLSNSQRQRNGHNVRVQAGHACSR